MSFLDWMSLVAALLMLMALSASTLRRLPMTTSGIYLGVGLAIGPAGLGWLRIDLRHAVPWLESLTTVAVVVSLFLGGLKLRLPLRHPAWRAAHWLAGPVMLVSIAGMAAFAHHALGVEAPLALLLGAMLAPTDPVLASAVSVSDAADCDRMRYGLSGEAGLNDGAAFPFVVFALLWLDEGSVGSWVAPWLLERVLWAIPAALVLGFLLGRQVGRLAILLRSRQKDPTSPSDFLALALIASSYVCAERIDAWGFLAVFAAGVGLRHAELQVVDESPHPKIAREDPEAPEDEVTAHPPAEQLVAASVAPEELQEPAVAAGVLVSETISFGETAERILEVTLMVLVGVCLAGHWDSRAIPLALALFVVIRPAATELLLSRTPTTPAQRRLMGWFGIRGIGTLFYLTYSLSHGLEGRDARLAIDLTISVVALSVVLHGASAQPILAYYARALSQGPDAPSVRAPSRRRRATSS